MASAGQQERRVFGIVDAHLTPGVILGHVAPLPTEREEAIPPPHRATPAAPFQLSTHLNLLPHEVLSTTWERAQPLAEIESP